VSWIDDDGTLVEQWRQWVCGLRGHADILKFPTKDDQRMRLECASCGRQTDGWLLPNDGVCERPTVH
jgi:hypothetical protein